VTGSISFQVTGTQVTGQLSASVGGISLPSQSFNGTQTCGKVQGTQTENLLGQEITATVTGTMAAGSATGTWSAQSADGSLSANGTFSANQ
jgi:hypothetical protein